ncbi:dihydrolipoyl dehydrogenase [Candidatus Albibeggiatoa sp. nov. NOAA]|uniref:dihydrolipoyl dehydrogenase n=1 Tax=Candidatus Albibeggiatoa sp. nov. NOAA TaxID=3162724 RepID=UPI003303D340|nr:dihydrolipoyl dehydrogenase [Thiotrichaceae bacterium]
MDRHVDVAIIGAGSAGLYALPQIRRQTDNFVLINGGHYGTTCARVGCMPSKVLIQAAEDYHHRHTLSAKGIYGGNKLRVDIPAIMRHVRQLRDGFVGRVTSNMERLKEKCIDGYATFLEPNILQVNDEKITAKKIVIATGTSPIVPAAWSDFQDYILTTDSLFEQETLPASIAVLGLGVIGLEMGQALGRLGIQVVGVDILDSIGGIKDPEINQVAIETIGADFPLWLGHAAELEEQEGQVLVKAGDNSILVDKILASLGRKPNITGLGLDKIGVALDSRGMPVFNPNTLQLGDFPIFIAGDANADRPILHEAGDDGRIAGYNASHDDVIGFKRKTPMGITFCDPNIVRVGQSWGELQDNENIVVGSMDFKMQGRAVIMGKNKGMIRVYADKEDGRLLGAEMIVTRGEHIAHLLAWAIQKQMTIHELLQMPYYHPVIEEGLQSALYDVASQLGLSKQGGILELQPL